MRGNPSGPALVGQTLGVYVLERLLGQGGMGSVYAARHRDIGKVVALKVLHPDDDPSESSRLRFQREGQAAGRIRHRNVVDVYDAGNDDGRDFLVMELLEGEDLRRLLQRESPLAVERACDLIVPVTAGLLAAHELGVVHRDLKPDNIFIASSRGFLTPKLLDFGVSKLTHAPASGFATSTGMMVGTPMYMSPEQAASRKLIDGRSDQYALGVILYECVTGRRPVEEPTLFRLMQRIIEGDYPAPRQLNPSLPAALERVIQTAMAREPEDRFASLRELGNALLPFAGEQVRKQYTGELASEPSAVRAVSASAPPAARRQPIPLAESTLRESVQLREAKGQTPKRRTWFHRFRIALTIGLAIASVYRLPFVQRLMRGERAWPAAEAPPPALPAAAVSAAALPAATEPRASTTAVRALAASIAAPTEPKPDPASGADLTKPRAIPSDPRPRRSSTVGPTKARANAPKIDPFADQK